METTSVGEPRSNKALSQWMARGMLGLCHVFAVTLIFLVISVSTVSWGTLVAIVQWSLNTPEIGTSTFWGLAVQFGLSACVWALLVISFQLFRERSRGKKLSIIHARGTVLTETLIILPVLILLIFGLAQLSVNNMTGVLNRVAAYQAARSVWVWGPEGIDDAELRDRARIAVALVMAPVAPSDFVNSAGVAGFSFGDGGLSPRANRVRMAMSTRFLSVDGVIGNFIDGPSETNLTFTRALDTGSMGRRGVRKFTHSYISTEVHTIINGAEVGVEYTYWHHQAFPIVGRVFGEPRIMGARAGYYQSHSATYTFPRQPLQAKRPGPTGLFGTQWLSWWTH